MLILGTGGEDYYRPASPVIEPGFRSQCASIAIADDDILEDTEVFRFTLLLPPGSNEQVQLSEEVEMTGVAIHDDDGVSVHNVSFVSCSL